MKIGVVVIVVLLSLLCVGCQEQSSEVGTACVIEMQAALGESTFEYDGSAEMAAKLLQSNGDEINLLPGLPEEWGDGHVEGLNADGGMLVDIQWARGELISAIVKPKTSGVLVVRYKDKKLTTTTKKGLPMKITNYGGLTAKGMRCCF